MLSFAMFILTYDDVKTNGVKTGNIVTATMANGDIKGPNKICAAIFFVKYKIMAGGDGLFCKKKNHRVGRWFLVSLTTSGKTEDLSASATAEQTAYARADIAAAVVYYMRAVAFAVAGVLVFAAGRSVGAASATVATVVAAAFAYIARLVTVVEFVHDFILRISTLYAVSFYIVT